MRVGSFSITAFVWFVLAGGVRADALDYDAPDGCPTRADFEQRLRARGRALPAQPMRMEVRIGHAQATLTLRDGERVLGERSLTAASCAEAADALAFVAALLLEEHVRPAKPRPVPRPVPLEEEAAVELAVIPEVQVQAAPALAEVAPVIAAKEPEESVPWRAGLAASALFAQGLAPKARPGLAAQAYVGRTWLELALGVRSMLAHHVRTAQGEAAFRWSSASLDACARWQRLGSAFCLDAELGRIRARGSDTTNPQDVRSLWVALGPRLSLRLAVWGPLHLSADLALPVPLTRDRFVLGPEAVHRVPPITFRGAIGLALEFE